MLSFASAHPPSACTCSWELETAAISSLGKQDTPDDEGPVAETFVAQTFAVSPGLNEVEATSILAQCEIDCSVSASKPEKSDHASSFGQDGQELVST
jgi:hypothetical protein